MAKNYYLTLGLAEDSGPEEIKAAFRRRALELHPDRSGAESGPFQDAQEAYSVLSNPEHRRHYDQQHGALSRGRHRPGHEPEPLVGRRTRGEALSRVERAGRVREVSLARSFETYGPSFDELFDRLWSNFELFERPKAEHLESLTVEVVVSPEEARFGGRVRVLIPARAACGACGGQGAVGPYECWRCRGQGALTTDHAVELEYPRGIRDGYAVQIALARFGIENFFLTVVLRVGGGWA